GTVDRRNRARGDLAVLVYESFVRGAGLIGGLRRYVLPCRPLVDQIGELQTRRGDNSGRGSGGSIDDLPFVALAHRDVATCECACEASGKTLELRRRRVKANTLPAQPIKCLLLDAVHLP